jgi:hypothetical protein
MIKNDSIGQLGSLAAAVWPESLVMTLGGSLTGKTPRRARAAAGLSSSMANRQKSEDVYRSGDSSGNVVESWAGIEVWIPIGYQNETGFHYGIEFISSLLAPSSDNRTGLLLP